MAAPCGILERRRFEIRRSEDSVRLTSNSSLTSASSAAKPLYIAGVLAVFLIVYFGSLFSPGLQDDADSTHAEAAREMLVTHDFVTLKVNGNRYLEKAPLMYWAVTLSYFFFGIT